ncbi:zinc-ribbon domain-containing protein [Ornithinimicrobium sp. Y1694]|uniref:zinc ribbon domain-containing protein n=1 Tax=Ornithinimicrobium sp. Y1694 TaxID=3418590 RepID=UPI003CEA5D07
MKFCTSCGSELASGAKFCGECGSPVVQATGWPTPSADLPPASTAAPSQAEARNPVGRPAGQSAPAADRRAAGAGSASSTTGTIDWKALPVTELVYPAVAVVLLAAVLFTDWYQRLGWAGATGEGPGALVILSTLLAIAAAVLGLPQRLLPDQLTSLPLPLTRLRHLLLIPLALAVLVAVVKVLGDEEGMGPGVALATTGIIFVAVMGLPSAALEPIRIAAMVCLGIALLSILWPMRHLFPLNSLTTPVLMIALVTAALLGWLILGLAQRRFPDWAAMGFFGIIWILITLTDASILAMGVGSLPVLFLMAGIALAMAPGMMNLMEPPAEMADRWLQTAAGFVTYGIFAAALVFIMAVTTLSALSNYGVSEGRAELIVMLLGSIISAVACGYARVKLIEEPVRGRMVALGIAAAGVLMAVLGAVGTEAELGLDATQVLLIGLIAPAILASLVLAPPSVRARYGLPWGEQTQLGT